MILVGVDHVQYMYTNKTELVEKSVSMSFLMWPKKDKDKPASCNKITLKKMLLVSAGPQLYKKKKKTWL